MSSSVDKDFLTTFAKGLSVIRSFNAEHMHLTLTEVAELHKISRASARRFLLTLESLGYVKKNDRKFSLTPKVLELGYSYLSTLDVEGIVSSQLEMITKQLNQSSSASVLDGNEIIYIARVPVRSMFFFNLQVGAKLPAYATSMGRVLLSGLSDEEVLNILNTSDIQPLTPYTITNIDDIFKEIQEIRRKGFAINDQELELSLRSVAVPVFNKKGQVKLTLNVSSHVSHVSKETIINSYVPLLKERAKEISASLL